jgi:hypothetical protein
MRAAAVCNPKLHILAQCDFLRHRLFRVHGMFGWPFSTVLACSGHYGTQIRPLFPQGPLHMNEVDLE